MDIRQHVTETIAKLKVARDQIAADFNCNPFVIETNRKLAAQNGAIQVLEQLLEETAEKPTNGKVSQELAEVLREV